MSRTLTISLWKALAITAGALVLGMILLPQTFGSPASHYEARRGWLALIAEEVEVSGATRFIREGHSLRDAIKLAGGDEALLADRLNRTIRVLLGDDSIALWCLGWDGMDNTWDDVVVTRMIRKHGTPR